uniref:NADH-ubiquinone oxidoreductase chain 3 n=1 Tax=Microcondylaea bonellii TaxID=1678567 RepID=A0A513X0G9_9BIVA|nr:NADH dehydrogenase subunit 3 [Microcondylaea bonellii]
MSVVVMCSFFCVLVGVVMLGLGGILASCWAGNMRDLSSPFECGFDPFGSSRVGFSLRFFMVMILFIVFDFETVLLMPSIFWVGYEPISKCGVLSLIGFLFILLMGIVYEMKEGVLEWGS